jgi:hypothetical protein
MVAMLPKDRTGPAAETGPAPKNTARWALGAVFSLEQLAVAATAYERLIDRLRDDDRKVRDHGGYTTAPCPSHEDRDPSLTIYRKPGRAKVVCWAGCDDRDILAALGLGVSDLYDEPKAPTYNTVRLQSFKPVGPKTRLERALEHLLSLPNFGEMLCQRIAQQEILEAEAAYWWRRAQQFDQVGTPECDLIATNCRNHAQLLSWLVPIGRGVA